MKEYTVKVFEDGSHVWYLNDKRHREDGPAVEWSDGSKSWWLNGNPLTEEEHRLRRIHEGVILMPDALAAGDGVILREQAERIAELEERISWDASAPFLFTLPSLSLDAFLNAQAERIAELEERVSWLETTLDTVDAALSKWRHE